jgi:hypothetical protein
MSAAAWVFAAPGGVLAYSVSVLPCTETLDAVVHPAAIDITAAKPTQTFSARRRARKMLRMAA